MVGGKVVVGCWVVVKNLAPLAGCGAGGSRFEGSKDEHLAVRSPDVGPPAPDGARRSNAGRVLRMSGQRFPGMPVCCLGLWRSDVIRSKLRRVSRSDPAPWPSFAPSAGLPAPATDGERRLGQTPCNGRNLPRLTPAMDPHGVALARGREGGFRARLGNLCGLSLIGIRRADEPRSAACAERGTRACRGQCATASARRRVTAAVSIRRESAPGAGQPLHCPAAE